MARIRSIKPEFFRHEGLQDLEARHIGDCCMLVFEGLWTQCDNQGIFPYKPRQLKLDILPFLKFDMERTLNLLENNGFLKSYFMDDKRYGIIPSFTDHQRFSGKEAGEEGKKYPPPPAETMREASGKQRGSTGEAAGKDRSFPNAQEREREKEMERSLPPPSGGSSPVPGESAPAPFEKSGFDPPETLHPMPDGIKRSTPCPHQAVIDAYHSCCPSLPRVEVWNEASRKVLAARWREKTERQEIGWWENYFRRVQLSDFLTGRVKDFVANLNWLIGPKNMEKVLNGTYDNRASPVPERLRRNIQACNEFINT